jgi:hypothetical protein
MGKNVKKQSMAGAIKQLEVGEEIIFDRSKYGTLNSTIFRIRVETGKGLSLELLDYGIIVKRLS